MWELLGIACTSDKEKIKRAYFEKLRVTNPEDKPEEFMALRKAYEEALAYADQQAADQASGGSLQGLEAVVDEIYSSIARRSDLGSWEALFQCREYKNMAKQDALEVILNYVSDHYYLDKEVTALLADRLGIDDIDDEAVQNLDPNFLEWFLYYSQRDELHLPNGLFLPGEDTEECDRLQTLHADLNDENMAETMEIFRHAAEQHPYLQMKTLLYRNSHGEDMQAEIEQLLAAYPKEWVMAREAVDDAFDNGDPSRAAALLAAVKDSFENSLGYQYRVLLLNFAEGDLLSAYKNAAVMTRCADYGTIDFLSCLSRYEGLKAELNKKYSVLSEEDEGNADLLWTLFMCCEEDGERAKTLLNLLLKAQPTAFMAAYAQMRYCEAFENDGEKLLDLARRAMQEFQKKGPNQQDAVYWNGFDSLITVKILEKEAETVSQKLEAFAKIYEMTDGRNLYPYVNLLLENKQFDQALQACNGCLRKNPDNFTAYMCKGLLYFDLEEYSQAYHYAMKSAALVERNLICQELILLILLRCGEVEKAHEHAREMVEKGIQDTVLIDFTEAFYTKFIEKDEQKAYEMMCSCLSRIDDMQIPGQKHLIPYYCADFGEDCLDLRSPENLDLLESYIDDSLHRKPDRLESMALKVRILRKQSRVEETLPILLKMKEDPGHGNWVERQLGHYYRRTIETDAPLMLQYFAEAYEKGHDAESSYYMGTAYSKMEEYEKAIAILKESYETDPDDCLGPQDISENYMHLGDYETALKYADIAIDLARSSGVDLQYYYRQKCRILLRACRFADVLRLSEEGRCKGEFAPPGDYLAKAHIGMGSCEQAIQLFAEKAQKDPSDADAALQVVNTYLLTGQYSKAEQFYGLVADKIPETNAVYLQFLLDRFSDNYEGLCRYYASQLKEAEAGEANNPMGLTNAQMSRVCAIMGDTEKAKAYAETALHHLNISLQRYENLKPLFLSNIATVLAVLGREKEALETLAIAEKMPLCCHCDYHFCKDALCFKSFVYELSGRYEEAAACCREGMAQMTDEPNFVSDLARIEKKLKATQ